MNITEAVAWQVVASFLRGELDHADDKTREDIALKCSTLDARARRTLQAGKVDAYRAWDEHLRYVSTEER